MQESTNKQEENTKRLSIGIDIDNVIARTDEKIRQLIKDTCGIGLVQEEITEYSYHKCGISRQQEDNILEIFHNTECENVGLLRDAKKALCFLKEKYRIVIVTSRYVSSREATERWLKTKKIDYDSLIFENNKHKTNFKFAYFVEDRWKHALELANTGTKVLLFDYPWNRDRPEHPNIKRVNSWKEVVKILT
jgi:uncharacterized HAD superfamily protein